MDGNPASIRIVAAEGWQVRPQDQEAATRQRDRSTEEKGTLDRDDDDLPVGGQKGTAKIPQEKVPVPMVIQ